MKDTINLYQVKQKIEAMQSDMERLYLMVDGLLRKDEMKGQTRLGEIRQTMELPIRTWMEHVRERWPTQEDFIYARKKQKIQGKELQDIYKMITGQHKSYSDIEEETKAVYLIKNIKEVGGNGL